MGEEEKQILLFLLFSSHCTGMVDTTIQKHFFEWLGLVHPSSDIKIIYTNAAYNHTMLQQSKSKQPVCGREQCQ